MPLITVRTSKDLAFDNEALLSNLSKEIASLTGKPEAYVMVIIENNLIMSFAGTTEPSAFIEVKSIGSLSPSSMSAPICDVIESNIGIPSSRIYINFDDILASNWGYNKTTFG